jgi:hypothetical protein
MPSLSVIDIAIVFLSFLFHGGLALVVIHVNVVFHVLNDDFECSRIAHGDVWTAL